MEGYNKSDYKFTSRFTPDESKWKTLSPEQVLKLEFLQKLIFERFSIKASVDSILNDIKNQLRLHINTRYEGEIFVTKGVEYIFHSSIISLYPPQSDLDFPKIQLRTYWFQHGKLNKARTKALERCKLYFGQSNRPLWTNHKVPLWHEKTWELDLAEAISLNFTLRIDNLKSQDQHFSRKNRLTEIIK